MKSLLVHGCYDADTLRTLKENGVRQFGFDLRGRSPNLIPFFQLKELLKNFGEERVLLTFENDKSSTVMSFLSLLTDSPHNYCLEFRDVIDAQFYDSFNSPFVWMFNPQGDWRGILMSKNIKGLLLPLEHSFFYQTTPQFWDLIDRRNLETVLHASNFREALSLSDEKDVSISVDLTKEVEIGFRKIDQDRLKKDISGILA